MAKNDKWQIAEADKLSLEQEASFRSGYKKITLKKGEELWRFVSSSNTTHFGAFWIRPETMKMIMDQFKYLDYGYGADQKQYMKWRIRHMLAIKWDWSDLSLRQKIVINEDVVAYCGYIKSQSTFRSTSDDIPFNVHGGEVTKQSEYWPGGCVQYVIPRFKDMFRENDITNLAYYQKI